MHKFATQPPNFQCFATLHTCVYCAITTTLIIARQRIFKAKLASKKLVKASITTRTYSRKKSVSRIANSLVKKKYHCKAGSIYSYSRYYSRH